MKTHIFLTLFILAVCRAELDSTVNNHLNALGIDPEAGEETVEKGQKMFEEQCRKYGGEDAVHISKMAKEEVVKCFQRLVNITEVNQEIEEAKPNGELDSVFKKYCSKSPQMLECATNLTRSIEPCLAEDQKRMTTIVQDVAKTLLNFTCFKEGDRIALFIAEGGPECLESKANAIQECVNNTFGKYGDQLPSTDALTANVTDFMSQLPLFIFNEAQCGEIDEVFRCSVAALETCKDPTPANVMESIFKVISKVIPCDRHTKDGAKVEMAGYGGRTNSAVSLCISVSSLLLALMLARI